MGANPLRIGYDTDEPHSLRAKMLFRLLADIVLIIHLGFVLFVVAGLILIVFGGVRGWRWIRNPWFRMAHLAAIAVVVGESWSSVACPLTTLENALRAQAGAATYDGGFIVHWLQGLLFYDAPLWVFTLCYSSFGALIAASWLLWRPRRLLGN